jgi:glutaredoxin
MDEWVMRLGLILILSVLSYFIWSFWTSSQTKVEKMDVQQPPPSVPTDPVPSGPGITMYGTDTCPWCVKQKEYFSEKKMVYTYIDCTQSGGCPNFVTGYPTIVKDGQVMHGFREL